MCVHESVCMCVLGPSSSPSISASKEKEGGRQPAASCLLGATGMGWFRPRYTRTAMWEPLSYPWVAERRQPSCLDPAESRLASSQTGKEKVSQGWVVEEENST